MLTLSLRAKRIVAFLLFATLGIVLLVGSPMLTKSDIKLNLKHEHRVIEYVPFEDQPFYESILVKQQEEDKSIIDAAAVTAPMPADTVANFYARMAKLYDELIPYYTNPQAYKGFFWDEETKKHFELVGTELLEVSRALDVSLLPESIRNSLSGHRSMQLKEVFDYIFSHATEPLSLEDQPKTGLWEFPQSPLTLNDTAVGIDSKLQTQKEYQFTTDTVTIIPELYDLVKADGPGKDANKLYSPGFYKLVSETPGSLIAPKWYLELPTNVRSVADVAFGENTLIQILLAVGIILIYVGVSSVVFLQFSKTYSKKSEQAIEAINGSGWISLQDKEAWQRLVLLSVFLIATQVAATQVGDYANITGAPMVLLQYVFSFILYASLSFTAFLLLEAIGRVICDLVIAISIRLTKDDLSRVAGSVMPASRLVGLLLSIYFVYRLLLSLGLPGSTILAFSTVPGLAIGLGASKMLGNLMAGFVIQTDRPIQVGDFCEIGGVKGYVMGVGLRSIRIQAPTALITIPNSKVDDASVINFMVDGSAGGGAKYRAYSIDLSRDLQLVHSNEQLESLQLDMQDWLEANSFIVSFGLVVKPSLLAGVPARIVCDVASIAKNWQDHDSIVDGFRNYLVGLERKYPGQSPEPPTQIVIAK
jgi:MscS family membrane protein